MMALTIDFGVSDGHVEVRFISQIPGLGIVAMEKFHVESSFGDQLQTLRLAIS